MAVIHITYQAQDTKSVIEAIGASNDAIPGQFYRATNTNEIFYGNGDGSLTIVAIGGTGYITGSDNTDTVDLTVSSGVLTADVNISADAGNNITAESDGLYAPKLTVDTGSSALLEIDSEYKLKVKQLLVTDTTVDAVSANLSEHLTSVSYDNTGVLYQEGDIIVITAGPEAWIHNGGTAGTAADFAQINANLTDAYIRGLISGSAGINYNSTSGVITLDQSYTRGLLSGTAPVSYNSSTGAISINANGITNALFRQSAGFSVVGKATTGTGNVADITASSDNTFLVRRAGGLQFDSILTSDLPSGTLTGTGTEHVITRWGASGTIVDSPIRAFSSLLPGLTFGAGGANSNNSRIDALTNIGSSSTLYNIRSTIELTGGTSNTSNEQVASHNSISLGGSRGASGTARTILNQNRYILAAGTSSYNSLQGITFELPDFTADRSIVNVAGFDSIFTSVSAGGAITNFYAFRSTIAGSQVKITNYYGLYLEDHAAATNRYGIYQAGPAFENVLAGSLSIGSRGGTPDKLTAFNSTGKLVQVNLGTGLTWDGSTLNAAGGGGSYTFDNGLTEDAGAVSWGGELLQNMLMGMGTHSMFFTRSSGKVNFFRGTNGASGFNLYGSDLEINAVAPGTALNGIILESQNGTRWKLTMTNFGALTATAL